ADQERATFPKHCHSGDLGIASRMRSAKFFSRSHYAVINSVGWIKTVGEWIGKRPADVPTAAAQKEKFEAKEALREAERKDAIKVLKTELQRLTQENQKLRATVERLTLKISKLNSLSLFLNRNSMLTAGVRC